MTHSLRIQIMVAIGIFAFLSLLFIPITAWGNECVNPIMDTGKSHPSRVGADGKPLKCQCDTRTSTCQWTDQTVTIGGGSTNPPPPPSTEVQIGNQIPAPQEPPPVTSAEVQRANDRALMVPNKEFVPLAGVPGLVTGQSYTMPQLLNALYRMLIVVGALIAVLKITFAGIKYMGTDNLGSKSGAKDDITSSLLGLLIIIAAVLIVNTVMGGVSLDVLKGPRVNYPPLSGGGVGGGTGGGAGSGGGSAAGGGVTAPSTAPSGGGAGGTPMPPVVDLDPTPYATPACYPNC